MAKGRWQIANLAPRIRQLTASSRKAYVRIGTAINRKDAVNSRVALTSDGKTLVVASWGAPAQIFRLDQRTHRMVEAPESKTLKNEKYVGILRITPDDKTLLIGNSEGVRIVPLGR